MAVRLSSDTTNEYSTFKRVLLIGDPGTGKTRFVATMPKPYIACFDPAGVESIIGLPGTEWEAEQFEPDATGWSEFKQVLKKWKKEGPQLGCQTFAIDSLSTASDAALAYVLRTNNNKRPSLPDWGEAIQEVKDMMADLAALKCHSALTAHLQVEKDEVLGGLEWLPLVFGAALPARVPIYFSEVYYTVAKTTLEGAVPVTKYFVQTKPDQRVKFVKSRMDKTGKLFAHHEEPNFKKLLEKAAAYSATKETP